jgi:hypothetical protein
VLEDPAVPRTKATLRAVAMQLLGEAYMGVKKDADQTDGAAGEESEYVRVETKSSRKRDSQRATGA